MKLNIENTKEIIQDFTNKTISIIDFNDVCIWKKRYTSDETYNNNFKKLSCFLTAELLRRENLKQKVSDDRIHKK